MRYSTMPQWVYVLPVVIGIGMMFGAVVFMLAGPGTFRMPVGLFWLATDAVFVIVCVRALGTRKDDLRVLRDGVRARATVLGAKTTGAYVNHVPQWVLRLRVEGSGDPYEATLRVLTFAPPVNGDSIDVCVDPQRKTHVVIAGADPGAPGAAAALDVETQVATVHPAASAEPAEPADVAATVQTLAELERMHGSGALADAEFDTLKRKLLGDA